MSASMLPGRSRTSVLVFLLPPLLLYGVAVLLPIVQSLFLSFFSWDGITDMEFVGLDNYVEMLTGDDVFWTSFFNALGYLAICLVLQLGGALVVASLLHRSPARPRARQDALPAARGHLHGRHRAPLPADLLAGAGRACSTRCSAGSGSSGLQHGLALERRHRARRRLGPGGLALHRPLHADHLRRAARGAARSSRRRPGWTARTGGRSSRRIRFPYIRPVWITTTIMATTYALRGFDIPYLLTNGGPGQSSELLTTYMYKTAFTHTDYGYASAISVFIVVECLVAVGLILLLLRRKDDA